MNIGAERAFAAPPRIVSGGAEGGQVAEDRPCIRCSYNLRGLRFEGNCPKCGALVADSLMGILLQNAAPEYINTLRQGFSFILNGILLQIVAMMAMVGAGFVSGGAGGQGATIIMAIVIVAVSVLVLMGYVRATEPDPGFVGVEKPDSARVVVRAAASVQIGTGLVSVIVLLMGTALIPPLILAATIGASIIGNVAGAVTFFAMMRYTRWLAKRVPDNMIIKRTKTYMRLLPLLYTVGILIVGLGPIIALVLYWNLLERMGKHLKAIVATGKPAVLPGMQPTDVAASLPVTR